MTTPPIVQDCAFCIDGNSPVGTHPDLGPVYACCPACQDPCPGCHGLAVFPADFTCLHCFAQFLIDDDLAAVHCPICLGVLVVIDLTTLPGLGDPHEPGEVEP